MDKDPEEDSGMDLKEDSDKDLEEDSDQQKLTNNNTKDTYEEGENKIIM